LKTPKKPKYQIIREYIIESIENKIFLPGHQILSENDLCRIFNVSRIVVRRAMDELEIRGILYRVQGKGAFVADAESMQQDERASLKPGLSVPPRIGISVPYINEFSKVILSTVENELAKQGVLSFIVQTFNNQKLEESKLSLLRDGGGKGFIIYTSSVPESEKNISSYINLRVPIVFVDRYIEEWPFDAVIGEDIEAGFQAVEHFYLKCRIREVGFFGADPFPLSSVRNRMEGLKKGLLQFGLPLKGVRMRASLTSSPEFKDQDSPGSDFLLVKKYLQENQDIEGVLVANDIMATVFYSVCDEMNIKIPEELSIISFMNDRSANLLKPPLTSFDQNLEKLGKRAAQILLDRIKNNLKDRPIIEKIPYKLIIRESCGFKST